MEAAGSGEEAEGWEGVRWRGACGEGLNGGVEEREAASKTEDGRQAHREAAKLCCRTPHDRVGAEDLFHPLLLYLRSPGSEHTSSSALCYKT